MKKITTVIFDFDGVIGNTIDEIKNIVVGLYEELHQEKVSPEIIKKVIGQGVRVVIKELKVPLNKVPYFEKRVRKELVSRIGNIKIFDGVKEVLEKIKSKGYTLGILSSNSQENIHYILKKNYIDFFDFIYSGSSFFGKGKILAKLIKKKGLNPKKTVYIGDETRDIQASQQNKVKVIAVSWGYNSEKVLKREKPDFFAKQPQDLLKILKKLC